MSDSQRQQLSDPAQKLLCDWAALGKNATLGKDRKWNASNARGPQFKRMDFLDPDVIASERGEMLMSTLHKDKVFSPNMSKYFEEKNPWFTFYQLESPYGAFVVDHALVFPLTESDGEVTFGESEEVCKQGQYIEAEEKVEIKAKKAKGAVMLLVLGHESA